MPSALHGPLAPEIELVICCARTRQEPELTGKIRGLLEKHLDWDRVFRAANQNAVLPLLVRQLRAAAPEGVPPLEMRRLSEANRANAVRTLNLTAALLEVLELFGAAGIVAIPYKGPVLAAQAYGDVALRQFEDVDIIVRHRDMEKIDGIMRELGYRASLWGEERPDFDSPLIPGEYKYSRDARAAIVELHTELTYRHFPVRPDVDEWYRAGGCVNLSGHQVRTLSAEDTLVAICVHGSKDFWARLGWIADVSELIQSQPQLDWQKAIRRAQSIRGERMLHLGLILAEHFFDIALPEGVAASVQEDRVAGVMAAQLESSLLGSSSHLAGAIARFQLRRRLVPGAAAGWQYALRLAMMPAEEDWGKQPLPGRLALFYFLWRPFRLMRKYGRSSEPA